MQIHRRPAQNSDYDWLLRLHHTVYRKLIIREFGYWDENEEFELFTEAWQTQQIQILLRDGQRVGMLMILEETGRLWLDEIQIDPQFQNQGIGTAVIEELIATARDRQLPVHLRVLRANRGAHRLYRRLGFRRIEEAKHHIVMELTWAAPGIAAE
ncbi:N-acetyltransferase [Nitrosomonas sp. sh817]|uniref:GNAT family N-acetyltransferase n=1 Tax=Nitrosomonas sp. sh817 TaxID=3070658 RepID=UPI0027DDAE85|nr:GNAT family N-acetyltransferase [Nitrosomonas sp. sh817]WMJ07949.1 GNAT family N-acetyltransferase [Nitrosomonas sp. sh817]